tara:strand:- start:6513 stop:7454 length:942 start_codon:yes stop_codon:yes gene_type:complete
MAYQNVGTPRFFVNVLEWLASVDAITLPSDHFKTLPVNPTLFTNLSGFNWGIGEVFSQNCFFAFLGHTRVSDNALTPGSGGIDLYLDPGGAGTAYSNDIQINVGKANSSQGSSVPEHDGFSLASITETGLYNMVLNAYGNVGSIILGTYYNMPNAPDLSLTMSREYGGTNEFTTYNGSSMSNTMWSKAPKWGDLGAWEIGGGIPQLSKSGRRSWGLKFSYMDDGDLWGSNQSLSFLDVTNNVEFDYNLLTDYSFFSQVWHKTLGGTLPFIFQPDSSNNNPDQFAICKFKDNSLKATQSAFNVYDISLSIEEVW